MSTKVVLGVCGIVLCSCGTITEQSQSSIMINGRSYELRDRTVQGISGSYRQTSIKVNNSYRDCLIDSPGSCEAAIRRGNKSSDDR
jgi:hypothetical protein